MEKTYVQGSLYLKKGPKEVDPDVVEALRNITYQLNDEESDVSYGAMDYSNVRFLHQLIINENGMLLRVRNSIGNFEDRSIVTSPEDLEENYIDFLQFLKSANYIGRRGLRTKPAENDDISYTHGEKAIVLYQSPSHTIVYNDNKHSDMFFESKVPITILDERYCDDWEFEGGVS